MVQPDSVRSRFATFIGLTRRYWLLVVLLALPLGLFAQQKYVTMRSDWVLTPANSVIVSVRRDLHFVRKSLKTSSDSFGWKYEDYKLTGIEKMEFIAQFRQRTFGLSDRTYAGVHPFWVYTLDADGLCNYRILVQGVEDDRSQQWRSIYDATVKGEQVDDESKSRQTMNCVLLVRQIKN